MMKKTLTLCIVSLYALTSWSQTMNILFKSGQTEQYNVQDIELIDFTIRSDETPIIGKRLVKMTKEEGNRTYTNEYTYDSQGRVVKKVRKMNGDNYGYYTYFYTDNLIIRKYYYSSSSQATTTEYMLENGLIVNAKNDYVSTRTNENGVYIYTWSGGNLKSIEIQSGGYYHKKSYQYTSHTAPQGFVTLGVVEDLGVFFGKTSKNLPSIFSEDNDEEITYDWTLKDGLPVKLIEMEKDQGGTYTTITTYEWE